MAVSLKSGDPASRSAICRNSWTDAGLASTPTRRPLRRDEASRISEPSFMVPPLPPNQVLPQAGFRAFCGLSLDPGGGPIGWLRDDTAIGGHERGLAGGHCRPPSVRAVAR